MRKLLFALVAISLITIGVSLFVAGERLQDKNKKHTEQSARQRIEAQKGKYIDKDATAKIIEYDVKEGDTLSRIAKKFLGSEREGQVIAEVNDIKNPDGIGVGQRLLIPLKSDKGYYQTGTASWYGADFHGNKTANGERYNMHDYTAAHKNLPLGTKVRVTNLKNGRSVVVGINDRGPFIKGRIIDLSYAAAKAIGMKKDGIAKIRVEVISFPKLI